METTTAKRKTRPSELLPCATCGAEKREWSSNKCRNCRNAAAREAMARVRSGTGGDTRSKGRGDNIGNYLVTAGVVVPGPMTMVRCNYWKPRRICILASKRTDAIRYIRKIGSCSPEEIYESVCSIAEVDVNLTNIDLSQYGWRKG